MSTKTCPYCAEEIKAEAIRCRYCHSWLSEPPKWADGASPSSGFGLGAFKGGIEQLRRPLSGRMLFGVCAAFARYFRIDPTLLRVIYVLATVFTLGAPGVILYLALVLIMPSDDDPGYV